MRYTHYFRIALCGICLITALLFNGCSVFSTIGHAISQGYENTVTYFNAYYNAKSLFDEAEDEIIANALSRRGQDIAPAAVNEIPGVAKQKLLQVIDKCSNILAFHPTSTLVDDALLLVGKSFYYQAEYLKAERKFGELLAQYPNSPLVMETQIWYARTEDKLGKTEEGVRLCQATIAAAQESGDDEYEAEAHQLLGVFYRKMEQVDKATLEYEKDIALTDDDETKANAYINLGDIYFSDRQYKKAINAYMQTGEYTSDIYSNYYSKYRAVIAHREIGEYSEGLTLVNTLIDDFRFKEYLPSLLFERANNYLASGRQEDAIDEYVHVDTTYASKEYAIRSAFQLGQLYEKEIYDYESALKYYTKVNAATGKNAIPEGRLKFTALTRHFDARKKIAAADSMLNMYADTTGENELDTLASAISDSSQSPIDHAITQSMTPPADSLDEYKTTKDTSQAILLNADSLKISESISDSIRQEVTGVDSQFIHVGADSLKSLESNLESIQRLVDTFTSQPSLISADSLKTLNSILDSIQRKIAQYSSQSAVSIADSLRPLEPVSDTTNRQAAPAAPKRPSISVDSIQVLKSIAAQELGDIFYSDLLLPDSAFLWYNNSLTWKYDRSRSPRILYILAGISRANPEKEFPPPEEYYSRLDQDFPESIYAEEARRFLGKEGTRIKTDTAAEYYKRAEMQIDAKQYGKAIKTLSAITKAFPKSPLAAKSEYAVGWILENYLAQPESAIVHYESIMLNYGGTMYARSASEKLAEVKKAAAIKADTIKTDTVKVDTTSFGKVKLDSVKTGIVKIDSANAGIIKTSSIKADTIKADKPAEKDSSKIVNEEKVPADSLNKPEKENPIVSPSDTNEIQKQMSVPAPTDTSNGGQSK